jgi:hypothetical protein
MHPVTTKLHSHPTTAGIKMLVRAHVKVGAQNGEDGAFGAGTTQSIKESQKLGHQNGPIQLPQFNEIVFYSSRWHDAR